MRLSGPQVACVALLTTAGLLAAAPGPAAATPPTGLRCGAVITHDTTLTASLGPCSKGGLVIGASNITLDLNGFSVTGRSGKTGDGVGILISGRTGVTVRNGRVSDFDAGVAIMGGSGNTVQDMLVVNNIGGAKGSSFGDGIHISGSDQNSILGNDVIHNGPFDGIGLVGASGNNVIDGNVVSESNIALSTGGIRIEGPGATDNVIRSNAVSASSIDGIAVFSDQQTGQLNTGNQILDNTVVANGFGSVAAGVRPGEGIRTFLRANSTTIQGNNVQDNAGSGILIASGSLNNTIVSNTATGNAREAAPGSRFDLHDLNDACDNNVWLNNVFGTANQACISPV